MSSFFNLTLIAKEWASFVDRQAEVAGRCGTVYRHRGAERVGSSAVACGFRMHGREAGKPTARAVVVRQRALLERNPALKGWAMATIGRRYATRRGPHGLRSAARAGVGLLRKSSFIPLRAGFATVFERFGLTLRVVRGLSAEVYRSS
jgi:hypothetical protein